MIWSAAAAIVLDIMRLIGMGLVIIVSIASLWRPKKNPAKALNTTEIGPRTNTGPSTRLVLTADEVEISSSPWIMGWTALHFGYVPAFIRMDDVLDLESGIEELLCKLRQQSAEYGCNKIIGFLLDVEPYSDRAGYALIAQGSMVAMKPIEALHAF